LLSDVRKVFAEKYAPPLPPAVVDPGEVVLVVPEPANEENTESVVFKAVVVALVVGVALGPKL
jgi:hypothetical protein